MGVNFATAANTNTAPYDDPHDFAYVIKIKENAPELLLAAQRAPVDMIFTGDYQPAERNSRSHGRMLEVCLDLGFPVFILRRSPLILRDLDLIQAIHQQARAVTAFSIIYTPGSPSLWAHSHAMEQLAPQPRETLRGHGAIAAAESLPARAACRSSPSCAIPKPIWWRSCADDSGSRWAGSSSQAG